MDVETGVHENKYDILCNKHLIERNKDAIHDLKTNCSSRCIPQEVFKEILSGYSATVHRLIIALCIVAILLFISNAIWLSEWSRSHTSKKETTVITNDGTSTYVGNDANIGE